MLKFNTKKYFINRNNEEKIKKFHIKILVYNIFPFYFISRNKLNGVIYEISEIFGKKKLSAASKIAQRIIIQKQNDTRTELELN